MRCQTEAWNSIIMGYGMHGHGEKALVMFLEIEKSGVTPNDATFTRILSVCARVGMILEGWWYFDLMRRGYMIEPKVEHNGCTFDLLSQAGWNEKGRGQCRLFSEMTHWHIV